MIDIAFSAFVGEVVSSLPASPMLQLGSAGELRLFS
jgi:hypothetical protein